MDVRAVIFDMDGVLVDTEPFYFEIIKKRLSELGIAIPDERLPAFVGLSAVPMWTEICQEFGLKVPVQELVNVEKEAQLKFFQTMPEIPRVPGVFRLVENVRSMGIPCAVASSSSKALVITILQKTSLMGYFDILVSGEEVQNGKPAPDIFITAAKRLSVPCSQCLVIEDSSHGIAGARAAGMKTVGFLNPNSGKQDLSKADFVTEGFFRGAIERIITILKSDSRT